MAAGVGVRMGQQINKAFLPLRGQAVVTWSLHTASRLPGVARVVLVVGEDDVDRARSLLTGEAAGLQVQLVVGGRDRHASEWQALRALKAEIRRGDVDIIVVHDAARPLASPTLFAAVIDRARRHGGAVPVRPQPAVIGRDAEAGAVAEEVVAVQTPQAFRAQPLLAAYEQAEVEGFVGTDTASCVERFSDLPVRGVPSVAQNIKITFTEDLYLAEALLAAELISPPPQPPGPPG